MDSRKKYDELKESGHLPKGKSALSALDKKLINDCRKGNSPKPHSDVSSR